MNFIGYRRSSIEGIWSSSTIDSQDFESLTNKMVVRYHQIWDWYFHLRSTSFLPHLLSSLTSSRTNGPIWVEATYWEKEVVLKLRLLHQLPSAMVDNPLVYWWLAFSRTAQCIWLGCKHINLHLSIIIQYPPRDFPHFVLSILMSHIPPALCPILYINSPFGFVLTYTE